MKNVLVVGSSNMDYTIYVNKFPLDGETVFGSSKYVQPGGKGENQAVALGKSNKVVCKFITAVGKDNDGKQIKEVLNKYNVHAYINQFDNITTGNAFIVVDENSENKIVIIKGANGEITKNNIPLDLIKECDYVLLQNEIPQEVNEFVITEAHKYGKVIIYNPAPFRQINTDLLNFVDYFVPNENELYSYTNTTDIEEGIKKLLDNNVKNVLVTLGTKGSMFMNKSIKIKVNAFKVKAVDTVAAGDTYVAYFVAAIACGYSIEESMKYASKASSITVQRKGSVISIPFGEEVF